MAIYTPSPPRTIKLPPLNPAHIAGHFGAMASGEFPVVRDFDRAQVGFMKADTNVSGSPFPSWPWGGLWTISSEGAGADGRRFLSAPLHDEEIVLQLFYSTGNTLYSRTGLGKAGFTSWQKRWL